jgi:hypothetical protein
MILHFEFASHFRKSTDPGPYEVILESQSANLDEAVAGLFKMQPVLAEKLARMDCLKDGKLVAMFVADGNLLQPESVVPDGATIRVLAPICGG